MTEAAENSDPARTQDGSSATDRVDVAVIGAGISGLAAARALIARGNSVAVLESRDRVGGRLRSPELGDGTGRVDLGATWFWPGEPRVTALVEELDIAVHRQYIDGDAIYHQPTGGQRIQGNPIDVPSFRFVDGAESLTEAVAAALPAGTVRLNTAVTRVEVADRATVHFPAGTITADHVVVALPPALAVERITFDPPLPERVAGLAAVTPVWMGSTVKVVVHFAKPFWRDHGLAGSAISHIGPMREIHDMSGPGGQPAAIFGFVPQSGPGPAPSEDEIRHQLVELYGPEAADPVEIIIADWRDEPDTSPPGVERLQAYQAFGHDLFQSPTLDGRLHWTSTETARVAPGHIEGALAAAERAVHAIASAETATTTLKGANR